MWKDRWDFFGLLGSAGDEKVKPEREENAGAPAAAAEEQPPRCRSKGLRRQGEALNPEQKHAVVSVSSAVAVKAGPGTGKNKDPDIPDPVSSGKPAGKSFRDHCGNIYESGSGRDASAPGESGGGRNRAPVRS